METYSAKSAAVRAARKALGPEAMPGADYVLREEGKRWAWATISGETGRPLTEAEIAEDAEIGARAARARPAGVATGFIGEEEPQPEKAARLTGKHKAALEAAQRGELPAKPDFSADTHKRFRPKLAEAVAFAEAGNLEGLREFYIKPISTSPKAIMRYRDLAIIALEARGTTH